MCSESSVERLKYNLWGEIKSNDLILLKIKQ